MEVVLKLSFRNLNIKLSVGNINLDPNPILNMAKAPPSAASGETWQIKGPFAKNRDLSVFTKAHFRLRPVAFIYHMTLKTSVRPGPLSSLINEPPPHRLDEPHFSARPPGLFLSIITFAGPRCRRNLVWYQQVG